MTHTITISGREVSFKEVTSLRGLKVGYQIYNTAENIIDFVNRIGLEDYFKHGYTLRYVLNNGQSPTMPSRNVYVAMLFKQDESIYE